MADGALPASVDQGPRLQGVFDLARPDRLAGWAVDRAHPEARLEVEILREGRPIALIRADRHRPNLAKGGLGSGDHGFALALDPPVEPGFEFTLTAIARAPDGARLPLRRAVKPGGAPEQRVIERIFEAVTAAPPPLGPEIDRLGALLDRIETLQHRIEATLPGADPAPPLARDLRAILGVTLAIALGALGLGLYSLLP